MPCLIAQTKGSCFLFTSTGCWQPNGVGVFSLERVLRLREDRDAFHWFLDQICSVVVGASHAAKVKSMQLPREWLSGTLEAFSLLCLENYYEMIKGQVEEGKKNPPLWTADGRGKRKNQGWSLEGVKRYNQLVELVRDNRAMWPKAEENYLGRKREEKLALENNKLKRKREAQEERERDWESAKDDFSSGSEIE